jgi:DNA-binding NarL/FixJ family response regulator
VQHIPVIFMAGLSETAHIVEAFEAGGVDYVVKPVRAQEVLLRLATHLRNARAVRLARDAVDVAGHGVLLIDAQGRALRVRNLGPVGLGERMLLLQLRGPGAEPAAGRVSAALLTPGETEVLSWIAKGKTNRDVAEILGMSPRTVNKHLEHVFEVLGVETRAAAAALASREMI